MTDTPDSTPPTPPDPERKPPQQPIGWTSESLAMPTNSARVPEAIGRGAFATSMIVVTGHTEFVLDFFQQLGRPHQLAARVIMPFVVMPRFIEGLRSTLADHQAKFGAQASKPPEPKPAEPRRTRLQEFYEDMKLPDPVLSGAYANGAMIGYSATEFSLDFVTNFYPQPAVSCRVFVSATQAPRILESLVTAYQQWASRQAPPGA